VIVEEAAPPAEPPALVRTRLLSLASVAVVCALFVLFALPHDPARSPVATPAPSPEPSRVVAAPARVPPGFLLGPRGCPGPSVVVVVVVSVPPGQSVTLATPAPRVLTCVPGMATDPRSSREWSQSTIAAP